MSSRAHPNAARRDGVAPPCFAAGLGFSLSGAGDCNLRLPDLGRVSKGFPGNGLGTFSSDFLHPGRTAPAPVPTRLRRVALANGTFKVDIAGPGVCDVLSTLTNVNINAGGNLVLDVDVNGFTPAIGQQWTVIASASGPIADDNGGKLFDAITDNSDRVNFTASISEDKKSLVLTALDANPGSVIVVR